MSLLLLINVEFTDAQKHQRNVHLISELTRLPGLAISSTYLEHRISYYADNSNQLYFQLHPYTYMDFIYAQ